MDRKTRRLRHIRIRSRRTKLVAGAAVAAASVVVLAAAAFGQQGQESSHLPKPQVDKVELTADPAPVDAGWEGQVGTDANLVGLQWNGDPGAQFTVEVRDQHGGWRKASDVEAVDNGPDPGSKEAAAVAKIAPENLTEPVWVGKDVTGVRVRLDNGTAQDLKLHVIDSTTGKKPETRVESTTPDSPPSTAPPVPSAPAPSVPAGGPGASSSTTSTTTTTQPAEQALGLGQGLAAAALASLAVAFIVRRRRLLAVLVVAVVAVGVACAPTKDGPPARGAPDGIVPRSSWAPDLPWNWDACPGGPEYAPYMSTAIVHHTVNSNAYGPGDSVGIMRGIWAYHVQSLGYCDIAYNFLIDNYGVPYEGRLGGIDQSVVGAHAIGANYGTTGVAMIGTFSSVLPSSGSLGTLENVIRWKLKIHGDDPFDDPAADILGHRDTSSTECPGDALYNYLPYTRHYVKAYW
jgi:hypothetical protein